MRRLSVDPLSPDPEAIAAAAAVLRAGGLVAFPTETVYGLGADALDPAAVGRIYEAKGRPAFNPIIVHVASIEHARRLARHWPAHATRLAQRFWPGPLTLVVPKDTVVPDIVTAGLDAVGIRVPAHPVALALIRAADLPVAAPSANRFTQLSPTSADHVAHAIGRPHRHAARRRPRGCGDRIDRGGSHRADAAAPPSRHDLDREPRGSRRAGGA